jgi:signal transduction histidine kinase
LARKKLPADSGALSYLNRIESSVDQITRIFDFSSAYERLGLEELVNVDVEKVVEEAVSLFSDLQNVKIINDCHGLTVFADSLLNKLFFNLIDNSLKHGKQTSQIRIYYKKENAGNLRLVYKDDGVGVPCAEKPKLFKEGYSTSGSIGYGLYLIKKIIDVYGWTIQETGEPGKGAKFAIKIPKLNKN